MQKDIVVTIIKKNAALLVRLEPSLKAAVLRVAKKQGMSGAAIMRMAARAFIASQRSTDWGRL